MNSASSLARPTPAASPLAGFASCHAGIVGRLEAAVQLPQLVLAANQARQLAADTLALFERSVLPHHTDEEGDLFPAVQRSAAAGEEREWAEEMAQQLTQEHRDIEALWRQVKPAVRAAAQGKPAEVDAAALGQLLRAYTAHALFEEEEYLPVAQQILGRNDNHLAALAASLHLRHVPPVAGYL